mmetsp:Transcript_34052/g.86154  ORF Transcript_34052/g.86154 Transcript_34052/m.86154 type:complete len:269 (+) Transcript_34052:428-1234(+)
MALALAASHAPAAASAAAAATPAAFAMETAAAAAAATASASAPPPLDPPAVPLLPPEGLAAPPSAAPCSPEVASLPSFPGGGFSGGGVIAPVFEMAEAAANIPAARTEGSAKPSPPVLAGVATFVVFEIATLSSAFPGRGGGDALEMELLRASFPEGGTAADDFDTMELRESEAGGASKGIRPSFGGGTDGADFETEELIESWAMEPGGTAEGAAEVAEPERRFCFETMAPPASCTGLRAHLRGGGRRPGGVRAQGAHAGRDRGRGCP